MINVWDYQEVVKVKITTTDGVTFEGKVVSVDDAEDESPDYGFNEDSISITDGRGIVGIKQSEIKRVQILD